MSAFSTYTNHTHRPQSDHQRVKVDEMDTGLILGRQFRAYLEVIKPSTETWYLRFTTPVPVYLQGVTCELDSGAARVASVAGATITGTWTPVTVTGRNRLPNRPGYPLDTDPAYVGQATVSRAIAPTGTITGGAEGNVRRVRCPLNQGSNSSTSTVSVSLLQILPAGDYIIKMEPITGVANTDAVNGILSLAWEEIPGSVLL